MSRYFPSTFPPLKMIVRNATKRRAVRFKVGKVTDLEYHVIGSGELVHRIIRGSNHHATAYELGMEATAEPVEVFPEDGLLVERAVEDGVVVYTIREKIS